MKRRWFIGGVVAALALLGLAGGAIMAQETTEKQSRFSAFAERVASILGLEADDVEDAMEQAKEELADEAMDEKLAMMVEKGAFTQQQADDWKAWMEAKPEGFRLPYFAPGRGGEHLDSMLAAMVEKGALTQAQADEYKTWIESAPEDVIFGEKRDHHRFEFGEKRGHHKFGDRDGKRWGDWGKSKSDDDDDHHSDGDDDDGDEHDDDDDDS